MKLPRLTMVVRGHILNSMRRLIFATLIVSGFSSVLRAQRVPGRDLLEFPIGTLAEAPALALAFADGFRNPVSILLPVAMRGRAGVSSLSTGADQGAASQTASFAAEWLMTTIGVSVTRAAVAGILRTTADPQPGAGDLTYSTVVISALAARRSSRHVTSGLALRYMRGRAGDATRGEVGIDGGVVADRLPVANARVALSTFMWRPAARSGDGAAFNTATDVRVRGDSVREVRVGYGFSAAPGLSREHFVSSALRYEAFGAAIGLARTHAFGRSRSRLRLGLSARRAGYVVGLSREEGDGGLPPSYVFVLTSLFAR